MDRHTYTIERAKLRVLDRRREEAKRTGNTTAVYDLSCEIRRSNDKIQQLLVNY